MSGYLPIDLMTSELRAKRRLKVETAPNKEAELSSETFKLMAAMADQMAEITLELRVLNARFESAFETEIEHSEIEDCVDDNN